MMNNDLLDLVADDSLVYDIADEALEFAACPPEGSALVFTVAFCSGVTCPD